ncbi:MAG: cytochrome c peroxidase [Planctomycetota bacterium]|nr:cytochrome c peroxidase [Planctomycetota bacterium]
MYSLRSMACFAGSLLLCFFAVSCSWMRVEGSDSALPPLPADAEDYAPLAGFDAMAIPADNPMTAEKVALGRQLYYDSRLSGDGELSCYSCHLSEKGLSDGRPTAIGAFGKKLSRNAPSLWNIGFHWAYYWDGRASSLEKQAAAAWFGGNMGAKDRADEIVAVIGGLEGYDRQFQEVFGASATAENIPMALAAYMRTIIGGNTAYDRWQAGDDTAVTDAAKRGYKVFTAAGCAECHSGVLFTDMTFHTVGVGWDPNQGTYADPGRFKVTGAEKDRGAFKTPSLRDVVDSGPYFHDGSISSLETVVRFMAIGGVPGLPNADPKVKRNRLSDGEVNDLLAFLQSLDEEADLSQAPEQISR